MSEGTRVKEEAHRLVDRLSDDATWADVEREVHLRRVVEKSIEQLNRGEGKTVEELREKYGLSG